jgi:putative ABC transport system ATP-binding protein
MDDILTLREVSKFYQTADHRLSILDRINLSVQAGESLAITGSSGSGKTTLLGLCAGLDRPSSGSILLNGIALETLTEDERAAIRNQYVGFIFQNFQLLPTLTALENVMVPLELRGQKNIRAHALDLLSKVGLSSRADHYPIQLSGGEQQRVSIARAFANTPRILFADEPTGNLDAETSERIEELLFTLNREAGTTLILVTHDPELAQKTNRIIKIKAGIIAEDQLTHRSTPSA